MRLHEFIPDAVYQEPVPVILAWALDHAEKFGGQEEIGHLIPTMPREIVLAELDMAEKVTRRAAKIQVGLEKQLAERLATTSTALPPPEPAPQRAGMALQARAEAQAIEDPKAAEAQRADAKADDLEVRDRKIGRTRKRSRFKAADGTQLYPDSDPKAPSEEEAFSDVPRSVRMPDANHSRRLGADAEAPGRFGIEGGRKPGYRHPQATVYLLNVKQNTAFEVTETLMRRRDLVPIFSKAGLPKDVTWGT